jgi:hypothetical protein
VASFSKSIAFSRECKAWRAVIENRSRDPETRFAAEYAPGDEVEESAHVNVWKTRLLELGLQVGPWLKELKRAIVEKRPDDHLVCTGPRSGSQRESELPRRCAGCDGA